MTTKEIAQLVDTEVKYYRETTLNPNPSLAPTMENLYELIDSYSSSKFRDGDTDSLGFKKVFYNIVNFPVEVASKMLNISTKDLKATAEDWASYFPAWIMAKELRMWLKNKHFARELNYYTHTWSKYGDLWLKKVKDEVRVVPPQNMIFRPDADSIKNIPLIEKHEYDVDVLISIGRDNNWENVEQTIKKGEKDGKVLVYECWFPEGYLDTKENWFIISTLANEVLASAKKDCPYKKLPFEKVPGRLPGKGQIEKLLEEQIYLNRLANYKSQGLHWTSKHIYQTRETKVASNLMTGVEDGDVLFLNDELRPVPVEERNLSFYMAEEQKYENNAFKRTFAAEPISGARAPAGTPLGSTVLQAKMASGFYEQKRQDLADFIKEVLFDWVLPVFKNQKRKEHKLLVRSILGSDEGSEELFRALLTQEMNKEKGIRRLTSDQARIVKSIKAERLKNKELEIPKGLYDNIRYDLNIDIVGEAIDTAGRMPTLQTLFQILGSNPTILQDKTIKRILEKMLNMAGFNPNDIIPDEVEYIDTMVQGVSAQRGGSLPSPQTAPEAPRTISEQIATI